MLMRYFCLEAGTVELLIEFSFGNLVGRGLRTGGCSGPGGCEDAEDIMMWELLGISAFGHLVRFY